MQQIDGGFHHSLKIEGKITLDPNEMKKENLKNK